MNREFDPKTDPLDTTRAEATRLEVDGLPKLVFRSGRLRGKVVAIDPGKKEVTIGRSPRNDIAIDDDTISSVHTKVAQADDGRYYVEDLGSKNGTFVRGERVERLALNDGDVFCVCKHGPEIQLTLGRPKLPSVLECTASTFVRTKSLESALREIVPRRLSKPPLELTGVRQLVEYGLEAGTRRERRLLLGLVGAVALVAIVVLGWGLHLALDRHHDDHAYHEHHQAHHDAHAPHDVHHEGGDVGAAHSSGHLSGAVQSTGSAVQLPSPSQPAPTVGVEVALEPVFGSLFFTYRNSDARIGKIRVTRRSDVPLRAGRVRLEFAGDAASLLSEPFIKDLPPLESGAPFDIEVMPKFSAAILADVNQEVTAVVSVEDEGREIARTERALLVYRRDVFNWRDPRRIAVFVDPDDPAVRRLMRRVWQLRPLAQRQEFPPPNLVTALTLLSALPDLGLTYLRDAENPIGIAMDTAANDRVNVPLATLLAGYGDCDDLSVLGCSLLEAARIPTAFAVGRGHVLFLFDSGVQAADLANTAFDADTVVTHGGRVWVPIEATDLARPGAQFATAWAAASRWLQPIAAGEMEIIEVREAWKRYVPMNRSATEEELLELRGVLARTDSGALATKIDRSLARLKDLFASNLAVRVEEIKRDESNPYVRDHAVAVLYAESGLFEEAQRTLSRALFETEEPPSSSRARDLLSARAEKIDPPDAVPVLLGNLAMSLTLLAHREDGLDRAANYSQLALEHLPPEAIAERGEMMLRLALTYRLRGDLSQERSWLSRAHDLDASLEEVYVELTQPDGTVSGPEERVREFLRGAVWKDVRLPSK